MTGRRILVPELAGVDDLPDAHALDRPAAHHLRSVLRQGDGDTVEVVPGDGRLLAATLRVSGRGNATIEDLRELTRERARPALALAAAVIKGKRMDWLVEKAAEVGVDVLVPWVAERSVAKLGGPRDPERTERWQTIMDGASRQCERLWRPVVRPPAAGLLEAIDAAFESSGAHATVIVADEALRSMDFPDSAPAGPWVLVTGPEGGFTDRERELFLALPDLARVGLGRRLLRAETAALVLAARWSALVEDIRD